MKKGIALTIVAVLVLSMGVMAFAESKIDTPEWFKDMMEWKRAQIKQAVKDNVITEEQAKYWEERLEYMEKYHEETGFNFPGGCYGGFRGGFGKARNGRGYGFGPGMMGGYWNTAPSTQAR